MYSIFLRSTGLELVYSVERVTNIDYVKDDQNDEEDKYIETNKECIKIY